MQFADFVYPAFNQIVSEISRMRYRSNGTFGVPMVIRMPYGGGVHGALYHSQSNEAYFTSTVGLKIVAPGTPADAKALLKASIRDPDPVLFFEPKRIYRASKGEVPEGDYTVPIGKARVVREGDQASAVLRREMARAGGTLRALALVMRLDPAPEPQAPQHGGLSDRPGQPLEPRRKLFQNESRSRGEDNLIPLFRG